MPIDHKNSSTYLSQRKQYQKGGIGRWYWDYRDKQVFGFINEKHKIILDRGCGEGITLEKLIKKYSDRNISGVDVVEENVKICRELGLPVSHGSLYDLSIESESIDLCVLSEVLEHLDNVELALENIKKVLKQDGQIIIVFPHDKIFKIVRILFFKFKEAFANPGHVNFFTPKSIKKILEKNGFKINKIINSPFGFWPISLHCIVLAKKV